MHTKVLKRFTMHLIVFFFGCRRNLHCHLLSDPTFDTATTVNVPFRAGGLQSIPYRQNPQGRKRVADTPRGQQIIQYVMRRLEGANGTVLDRRIAPSGEQRVELSRKLSLRKLCMALTRQLGCLSSVGVSWLHRQFSKSNDVGGRHLFVVPAFAGRLARNRTRSMTTGDHWAWSQIRRLHVWQMHQHVLSPPRAVRTMGKPSARRLPSGPIGVSKSQLKRQQQQQATGDGGSSSSDTTGKPGSKQLLTSGAKGLSKKQRRTQRAQKFLAMLTGQAHRCFCLTDIGSNR
eukprot:TRINITY_DN1550_c0_g1_i2.p1 TRINITY_DN1550_c0_g1~~TRINITY_DN1550_c0_g1_i2.p1  ORF type:complete len:288 (+),score=63.10 TRINITY_DN1550_c0_g1_i2:95-958(+)